MSIEVIVTHGKFSKKRIGFLIATVAHWNELGVNPIVVVQYKDKPYVARSLSDVGLGCSVASLPEVPEQITASRFKHAVELTKSDIVCITDDDLLLRPTKTRMLLKDRNKDIWWEEYINEVFETHDHMGACAPIHTLNRSAFGYFSPNVAQAIGGCVFVRRETLENLPDQRTISYQNEFSNHIQAQEKGVYWLPLLEAHHLGYGQSQVKEPHVLKEVPEIYDAAAYRLRKDS